MAILTRRRLLAAAGAMLAAPVIARLARAQAWPTRPIRAMVPFAAGSTIDIIARIVFEPLAQRLGQPIIVENRGGAGGTIGTAATVHAEPDGHTWLINASAHSAAPAAYPKIPYDPARDFSAVISFGSVPNVVIVSPAKGFKTLADLVAAGKARELTFSSAGVGSATHWAAERLRLAAGFKPVHVPYRVGPDAVLHTVTGTVDFMCPGLSGARAFIDDGKALALAVCPPKRSVALPNVPTTIEAGSPDSDYTFWNGMFVPKKTPREIIARLYRETQAALETPIVKERFAPQGIEPMTMTPEEFDALVVKEVAGNLALVKAAGLKFN